MKTLYWVHKQTFDEKGPIVGLVNDPHSPDYIRVWIEPVTFPSPSPEVQTLLNEANDRYKKGTDKMLKV